MGAKYDHAADNAPQERIFCFGDLCLVPLGSDEQKTSVDNEKDDNRHRKDRDDAQDELEEFFYTVDFEGVE